MDNPFSARWTAQGNNLCTGHWEIAWHGQALELDAAQREHDLGTRNIYSYIFPDDDDFAEGLAEDDWIVANAAWLGPLFAQHGIPIDELHMRLFYRAVNAHDWRCGSCGGCL